MAFLLSPGVHVTETDLTNVVPSVATSIGAYVGVFQWGPVLDIESLDSQNNLVKKYGKPNAETAASFFSAANYLDYTNQLKIVRVVSAGARNAVSSLKGIVNSVEITNGGSYDGGVIPTVTFSEPEDGTQATGDAVMEINTAVLATAGTGYAENDIVTLGSAAIVVTEVGAAGEIVAYTLSSRGTFTTTAANPVAVQTVGDGVGAEFSFTYRVKSVTVTDPGTSYETAPTVTFTDYDGTADVAEATTTIAPTTTGLLIQNREVYEANFEEGNGNVGMFAAKYPGSMGNSIQIVMADKATYNNWAFKANFPSAPNYGEEENDELHIIVIDKLGKFTGVKGAVLEKFGYLSKAFDSKGSDGNSNFYKTVLNRSSSYVYWMDFPAGTNWGAPKGTTFTNLTSPVNLTLAGGADDNDMSDESSLLQGWELFRDPESTDINLLIAGPVSAIVSKFIIQNIAEFRKDCFAFVSPPLEVCVNNPNVLDDVIEWREAEQFNVSSSYGALDSGWKYQYDQYNDTYRWVPLCADMAGLHARTDSTNDAWWAAGGLNRGQIKNVVKLSWNPGQMARDRLYQAGINPVTSFPGQGIVLFGNKTLLAKPSAFDRINVRRLFIVLEKAISRAARYSLFEFNDPFTRAQLKAMIEPYLRMIQGRRGITGFKVICDETNNDDYIVSTNQLVCDIFIKPNYVAEFITLNFIASNNSAMFSENG